MKFCEDCGDAAAKLPNSGKCKACFGKVIRDQRQKSHYPLKLCSTCNNLPAKNSIFCKLCRARETGLSPHREHRQAMKVLHLDCLKRRHRGYIPCDAFVKKECDRSDFYERATRFWLDRAALANGVRLCDDVMQTLLSFLLGPTWHHLLLPIPGRYFNKWKHYMHYTHTLAHRLRVDKFIVCLRGINRIQSHEKYTRYLIALNAFLHYLSSDGWLPFFPAYASGLKNLEWSDDVKRAYAHYPWQNHHEPSVPGPWW